MFIFSFCGDAKRKNEPKKKNTLIKTDSKYLSSKFSKRYANENFVRKYKESVAKVTTAEPFTTACAV